MSYRRSRQIEPFFATARFMSSMKNISLRPRRSEGGEIWKGRTERWRERERGGQVDEKYWAPVVNRRPVLIYSATVRLSRLKSLRFIMTICKDGPLFRQTGINFAESEHKSPSAKLTASSLIIIVGRNTVCDIKVSIMPNAARHRSIRPE